MRNVVLMFSAAMLLASCAGQSAGNRMARCEYRADQWSRAECARERDAREEQQDAEERQRERIEHARENRERDAPRGAQLAARQGY
jgi:hypothetical protein